MAKQRGRQKKDPTDGAEAAEGVQKGAQTNGGGSLGFEAEMFKAADKLRGNMEPSDYKHVVLGLVFLKYISDAFELKHAALLKEDMEAAEDKDEYLAEQIFWVPKNARWSHLKANAKLPTIGTLIDDAMRAIEAENQSLEPMRSLALSDRHDALGLIDELVLSFAAMFDEIVVGFEDAFES